jgi:hypothetical protein
VPNDPNAGGAGIDPNEELDESQELGQPRTGGVLKAPDRRAAEEAGSTMDPLPPAKDVPKMEDGLDTFRGEYPGTWVEGWETPNG